MKETMNFSFYSNPRKRFCWTGSDRTDRIYSLKQCAQSGGRANTSHRRERGGTRQKEAECYRRTIKGASKTRLCGSEKQNKHANINQHTKSAQNLRYKDSNTCTTPICVGNGGQRDKTATALMRDKRGLSVARGNSSLMTNVTEMIEYSAKRVSVKSNKPTTLSSTDNQQGIKTRIMRCS